MVNINGESFRLKDKRKAGLLGAPHQTRQTLTRAGEELLRWLVLAMAMDLRPVLPSLESGREALVLYVLSIEEQRPAREIIRKGVT